MSEERSFLHEGNIYVSNTRVIINGTTYATANVTSVRTAVTPPNTGCATILAVAGAVVICGGIIDAIVSDKADGWGGVVLGLLLLAIGIAWFRSVKPTYRLMLATAGGEREGLVSMDAALVGRLTGAISDAIIYRG